MTKRENPTALTAGAQVFTPVTREQLLRSAFAIFKQQPLQTFNLFHDLEGCARQGSLPRLKTAYTILQPLEEALAAANFPTDGTIRCLMQPPFSLTSHDLHAIACDCDADVSHVFGHVASLMIQGYFGL